MQTDRSLENYNEFQGKNLFKIVRYYISSIQVSFVFPQESLIFFNFDGVRETQIEFSRGSGAVIHFTFSPRSDCVHV